MKDMGENSHVCPSCGYRKDQTEESNTHALKPYTILQGKYLVGNILGEGGFGITYIGLDLNLEIRVAIKEFYPNGFVTRESGVTSMVTNYTSSDRPQYEKWKDSFVREARSLAKFSDLPGIVHVKDFFQENNTAYIVMEYVEGETLKSHLKNCGGIMPVQETLSMMRPVIQSLAKIHQAQIIHRDISPDNIMIQEGGSVKLIDFGAARDFGNGDDRSLSVLLKPGFAPEEQYRSKGNQGPWTDVYALCATIYRCITGEKPPESMERMRQDTLKYPSSYGISITKSEESALLNGLAVLAENRIKTMGELEAKLYDNTGGNASYKDSYEGQSLQNTNTVQSAQNIHSVELVQNNSEYIQAKNKGVHDKKKIYFACIAGLTAIVLILLFVIVYQNVKKEDVSNDLAVDTGSEQVTSTATGSEEVTSTATGPASESDTNTIDTQSEPQNELDTQEYKEETNSTPTNSVNINYDDLKDTIMIYYATYYGTNNIAAEIDHETDDTVTIWLYDPYATTTSSTLGFYDFNKKTGIWTNSITGELVDFDAAAKAYEENLAARSGYSEYILWYSSEYALTESDLVGLSAKELTYARNEIYARHGYIFKSSELNNYFRSLSWYEPNPYFDGTLYGIEKNNVAFIKNYQERNNLQYKPY